MPFKRLHHKETKPLHPGRASRQVLLACLSEEVTERFSRLTDLTVTTFPMDGSACSEGCAETTKPVHPDCMKYAKTSYCRRSWQSHLAELRRLPEVHWHECRFGLYCAMLPVVWQRRCLAVCQLVCPQTISGEEFERRIELLDVLIENFLARESELLTQLTPADNDKAEAAQESYEVAVAARVTHPQILAALEYINRHLTEPSLTVANIARDLGVNATYLAHLFSQQIGQRMSRYIAQCRIELAKQLLKTTNWQIKRVAFESGHGNPFWFSEVFRAHTGLTPTKYRLNAKTPSAN